MKDQPKRRGVDMSLLVLKMSDMMDRKYGVSDYDPLMRAIELAEDGWKDGEIELVEVVKTHLAIAPYFHAKLRQINLVGGEDGAPPVKLQLLEKLKAELD